jgi:hypothetical protein
VNKLFYFYRLQKEPDMNMLKVLTVFLFSLGSFPVLAQVDLKQCIYTPEDQRIAEQKLHQFAGDFNLSTSELVVKIGYSFLGTPYVVATLENGSKEWLVINLRQLDCTTFAENCLALARTVKQQKSDFVSFVSELQHIRYRDGIRSGYPSRLHYFSEWIANNTKKGLVSDQPNRNGVRLDKTINFMSVHPEDYPVLKEHPELITEIALQEKNLSAKGFWYFPKDNPDNLLKNLHEGDIIGLTSAIDGVDVNHVGIIVRKNNEFHLLHAPLSGKKVLVSDDPITDFLKPASKNSGIIIARPVN